MGVHIAAIAGKMLENRPEFSAVHGLHHRFDISGGLLGIFAEGAGVYIVGWIVGHIADRSQIDVDAQGLEQGRLFYGIADNQRKAALGVQGLRGVEGRGPEGFVQAYPVNVAALLVHTDQQGNFSGLLILVQDGAHAVLRLALEIRGV